MIEIKNISFSYNKSVEILKNVTFSVDKGEILNILGPNGCGKSTLIKAVLGFLEIDNGSICVDGIDLKKMSRGQIAKKLSYVPQIHGGAFSYSVLDVVLMGRTSQSPWYKFSDEDYEIAEIALKRVNISHYAERSYLQLSGGERQLVLIARALAQKSKYFIMDEPVTGLDYGNQFMLLQTVKDLASEGLAFILTTHHPEHAVFLGGRAMLIKKGSLIDDGKAADIINTESICELYNMSREMVEKFNRVHYADRVCKG